MTSSYDQIQALVQSMQIDSMKFKVKKTKVGGNRIRSSLLQLKKLCDSARKEIAVEIAAMPKKTRAPKKAAKSVSPASLSRLSSESSEPVSAVPAEEL
jgi:hypothetical protein